MSITVKELKQKLEHIPDHYEVTCSGRDISLSGFTYATSYDLICNDLNLLIEQADENNSDMDRLRAKIIRIEMAFQEARDMIEKENSELKEILTQIYQQL